VANTKAVITVRSRTRLDRIGRAAVLIGEATALLEEAFKGAAFTVQRAPPLNKPWSWPASSRNRAIRCYWRPRVRALICFVLRPSRSGISTSGAGAGGRQAVTMLSLANALRRGGPAPASVEPQTNRRVNAPPPQTQAKLPGFFLGLHGRPPMARLMPF